MAAAMTPIGTHVVSLRQPAARLGASTAQVAVHVSRGGLPRVPALPQAGPGRAALRSLSRTNQMTVVQLAKMSVTALLKLGDYPTFDWLAPKRLAAQHHPNKACPPRSPRTCF